MELYIKYLPSAPFKEHSVPPEQLYLDQLPRPKVDAGFDRFAADLRALDQDDAVPVLVLPALFHFVPPESFPWKTREEHYKFTKLQVALWIAQDDNFNKPVHLDGVSSMDELRLISGMGPQFVSVTINWSGQETDYDEYKDNLAEWLSAAGVRS